MKTQFKFEPGDKIQSTTPLETASLGRIIAVEISADGYRSYVIFWINPTVKDVEQMQSFSASLIETFYEKAS